ncbi:MAG: peptidylprolyl isomerase [Flavobacteriaceae bacterium]|nr:peptidylprolyl isomerase [Flavobacteriaceae bacterium]
MRNLIALLFISGLFLSCNGTKKKSAEQISPQIQATESHTTSPKIDTLNTVVEEKAAPFLLNDENAIPFFKEYAENNKENKVRITTEFGSFDILLYKNTPYHRANFIYLTKKGYFDGSLFHRVVKNFIIQGGNSDSRKISEKRRNIGRYLLPPDTRNGNKHHRGTISMPSSEIDNPHKLASPYEFFIVVTNPGSYHLDKKYTAFGKVIKGMDVVDKINRVKVDKADWPWEDISMTVKIIE